MTDTPRTTALIDRHRIETRQLYADHRTLPDEVLSPHAQRQTKELIDHTYSLERELAEARKDVITLCLRLCMEPTDSHAPETRDVLERYRAEWEAAAKGEE